MNASQPEADQSQSTSVRTSSVAADRAHPKESLRIANCSGFYGDRLSAMREMLDGGPVDVLTGDYLAELTMLILGRDQLRDPSLGYARTFLRQVEECLGDLLERGIRVVANAGGLNPSGLVGAIEEVAHRLGLSPVVAMVDGDDLMPRAAELGFPDALTANAYLGAFGIARALSAGADIVVTGRVSDASLVVGPGIWRWGWSESDQDELAGAVVAGHIVECGTQATGGNFSGFLDLPRDSRALGFPIAELRGDGSSVITKHPNTAGMVTIDTVTAQLMYEIQGPVYLNPDASVDLRSIRLSDAGPDRVLVDHVKGVAPPDELKVATNILGGFRNQMEFVLVGLDIETKEAWLRTQLATALAENSPAEIIWTRGPLPPEDPSTEEGAACLLRCVVKDPSAEVVGKPFTSAGVELALASYPGFTLTAPPGRPSAFGIYKPAYVPRDRVQERVTVGGEVL